MSKDYELTILRSSDVGEVAVPTWDLFVEKAKGDTDFQKLIKGQDSLYERIPQYDYVEGMRTRDQYRADIRDLRIDSDKVSSDFGAFDGEKRTQFVLRKQFDKSYGVNEHFTNTGLT